MKKYNAMQLKVLKFSEEDVIRTSGGFVTAPGDEVIGDSFDEMAIGK